ncbi:hypothetical protein ACP70R_016758 [Stipagrostis hirtigluma subsp. patula]
MAMGCFQKAAAIAVVGLLLFLACDGAAASGDPSSSSTVVAAKKQHQQPPAPGRTLLGDSENPWPWNCHEMAEAIDLSQVDAGPSRGYPGQRDFLVSIYNQSPDRTAYNVHVSCGDFDGGASGEFVDPNVFRRVGPGDCIVNNGGAMTPTPTDGDVLFTYSHDVAYELKVASASCAPS